MELLHMWGDVSTIFQPCTQFCIMNWLSTKKKIIAPSGPGVNVECWNKRPLIEVFLHGFQYTIFGQLPLSFYPLKAILSGQWNTPFSNNGPKFKPIDFKMKPSTLTFNDISAIKRELENLHCNVVAAVWNLFSFSHSKF